MQVTRMMRRLARFMTNINDGLKANQALDFDDLIMQTIRLFEQSPETLHFTKTSSTIFTWMNTRILTSAIPIVTMLAKGFRTY